jgi:hypothetical protein
LVKENGIMSSFSLTVPLEVCPALLFCTKCKSLGILIDIGDLFFFKKKVPQNGKQINNAAVIVVSRKFYRKKGTWSS